MVRKLCHAECAEQTFSKCVHVGVAGKHPRDSRMRPQGGLAWCGFENGVVASVGQRYGCRTQPDEDILNGVRIQGVEVHYELTPVHRRSAPSGQPETFLEVVDVRSTSLEGGVLEYLPVQRHVGLDALNDDFR